jgi:hypothetical protein
MPEQTEERPFTADIADLFAREAVDDTAGVGAYTMALRCMECRVAMVALLPAPGGGLPAFGCPQCTRSVEVSFT